MNILVVPAFFDEIKSFLTALEDVKELTLAKRKCWQGKLNNHTVFVSLSSIGAGHAAANITALCERLRPDCILMCGTSGGLLKDQQVGDIVIGDSIIDIDFYALPHIFRGTPFEPCLRNPHLASPLKFEHHPDELFLRIALDTDLPRVTAGKVVSSSTFPAPLSLFEKIKELECQVIEVEAAGILNAVAHYAIPTLVIKTISNLLNEAGKDQGTTPSAIQLCSDRLKDYLVALISRIDLLEPLLTERNQEVIHKLVTQLNLERHPEGGFYRRIFRSEDLVTLTNDPDRFIEIPTSGHARPSMTSIYYLVEKNRVSTWHRIKSDEMWHFYEGSPLEIYELTEDGNVECTLLGNPLEHSLAVPQYTVKSGRWFAAKTTGNFSLCGCAVAPGFEFADLELGKKDELMKLYPQHAKVIFNLITD